MFSSMLTNMLGVLTPQLNKIGQHLLEVAKEHGVAEPGDVRIVILTRPKNGKVHTFMQYVASVPTPTAEDPNLRTTSVLSDKDGKPLMFNIEQLASLIGGA